MAFALVIQGKKLIIKNKRDQVVACPLREGVIDKLSDGRQLLERLVGEFCFSSKIFFICAGAVYRHFLVEY